MCHLSAKQQVIQRHVWEDFKEQVTRNKQSENGTAVYKLRCKTIERSFADAKVLHGLRRCRFRGQSKTQEQVLMTAVAQNINKIARYLAKLCITGKTNLIANYFGRFDLIMEFEKSFGTEEKCEAYLMQKR